MPEKLSEEKERALLNRMRLGDGKAREDLINALAGLAEATAVTLCKTYNCWELKEKMVIAGQMKLIKAVDGFKPEKGLRLSTFAGKGIYGGMIDFLKKEGFSIANNHESLDAPNREDDEQRKEIAAPSPIPDELVIERERALLLHQAINELHEEHREVILLHHFGEIGVNEIASQLGVSVSAVKSRLFHARAKLRERLSALLAPISSVKEVKQNA